MKGDLISRSYAISEIRKAIDETEDERDIGLYNRFIDFLKVLPAADDIESAE